MRKLALLLGSMALTAVVSATSSWAGQNTLFVDPENGTDAGNTLCAQSSPGASVGPCATLNVALQNANAGATIFITRPGIFAPIYLNQNVSIIGPDDGQAIITWASTPPGCVGGAPGSCNGSANATYAVDIEAGASNGNVKFKHIIISANSTSAAAMHIGTAFVVSLTGVNLRCGSGTSTPEELLIDSSQGSQMQLYLHDSDLAFCSGGGGMVLSPSGATLVKVNMNGGEIHNLTFGVQANATSASTGGGVEMVVTSSQFFSFNNSAISFTAPTAGVPAVAGLIHSSIVNTGGAAIKVSGAGAGAFLHDTSIVANASGVNVLSGAGVGSYGDNVFQGNGTDCEVSGSPTACSSALGHNTFN
jgi:hypothetical protein